VGTVDVTATTLAGTSPAVKTDGFTYMGCVVPGLKGKNLTTSRKRLGSASCKLGKIGGRKGRRAKVVKQSPVPGKVLAPGSAVNVKVGTTIRHSSH
jgi:beta-lactam-binding protein with PASTA domain